MILDSLASYRGIAGTSAASAVVNAALRLIAVKLLDLQKPVASKQILARYSHEVKTSGLAGAGKGLS